MNIMRSIKIRVEKLRFRINPVRFARKIGVKIGNGTCFYAPEYGMFSTEPWLITIGNNCHITYGVRFITHDGGTLTISNEEYAGGGGRYFTICGNITVGDNVYIGERTTILPGVSIGDNVIIGCHSVVSKNIPSNTVAAGVPCKVINSREKYIEKMKEIMAGNNPRYFSDLEEMHSLNPRKK